MSWLAIRIRTNENEEYICQELGFLSNFEIHLTNYRLKFVHMTRRLEFFCFKMNILDT